MSSKRIDSSTEELTLPDTKEFIEAERLRNIGLLTAGVAHDFGNTITAIGILAENSLRSVEKDDPLKETLELIVSMSQNSASYIELLLQCSNTHDNGNRFIAPSTGIRMVYGLLKRFFPGNIALELSLSEDLPKIWFNDALFQQILLNLAINASNAMPSGGTLRLSTFLAVETNNIIGKPVNTVCISISDTGCGFSESRREHIFEAHNSDSLYRTGHGLGLYMVKRLMEENGGSVSCTSKLNKGSEFLLHFPIKENVDQEQIEHIQSA